MIHCGGAGFPVAREPLTALWAHTGKPACRFVTRGLLGWSDREGAGDRGESST
jgi:hypothetical protein